MDSREKKTYGYRERDEIKRQQFIEKLANWEVEAIVYVDESGMDNREDYGYSWNEKVSAFMPSNQVGIRDGLT